ncbi:MAG: 1-acyl-sn-glycerol-3-phosphate acyltransferase [Acidimicrobiales bacterium]
MSIATVLTSLVFGIWLAPLILLAAIAADLISGIRRWRFVRLTLFSGAVIAIETAGILASATIWLSTGLGARIRSSRSVRLHDRLQYWYNSTILRAAQTLLSLDIEVEGIVAAEAANAVVIGRHVSHIDAALPAVVFGRYGHGVRYVLASGLQWGPCLDIVGNRQGDVFVNRAPGYRSDELSQISRLGARIDKGLVAAVFPEGTFFTPARSERALTRIEQHRPSELARARALRHLLPPRPAGLFALLDSSPDSDVVVLGHVGLEHLSTIKDIIRAVPFQRKIGLRLWRISRCDVPDDHSARVDWLYNQWALLDEWIDQHQ